MSDETTPAPDAPDAVDTPDEPVAARPLLRIVNPDATPEEVAAIVAVLSALGGGAPAASPRRTPVWNAPARGVRGAHHAGPGAWRASGLPR